MRKKIYEMIKPGDPYLLFDLTEFKEVEECEGHEWAPPIKVEKDETGVVRWYYLSCIHCPCTIAFATVPEAEEAIRYKKHDETRY